MDNNLNKIFELYNDSEVNQKVKESSLKYIDNYWLDESEWLKNWLPIKNGIFCSESKYLPDLIFRKEFELIAQRGGLLFTKDEYNNLQRCMKVTGDNYFVFIENEFVRNTENDFPHLRFKFPVNTSWEDLNNNDDLFPDISHEIMYIMNKHFFVFGDSGKWGKYSATDYNDTPLDIIGFKPEFSSLFEFYFKPSKKEYKEIYEWLPQQYKKIIK